MKRAIAVMLIFSTCFLYGCASFRPICDMRGIPQWEYDADLADCRLYAERISPGASMAAGAGIGAGIGALTGLIVGTAFGVDAGQLAGFGAILGGLHGAAAGGGAAAQSQMDIIKNCMRGRGYNVLN